MPDFPSALTGLQDVANLGKEQLLLARRRRFLGLCAQQLVHQLDDAKQHQGDDDEVDQDGNKIPPAKNGTLLLGFDKGIRRNLGRQWDEMIGEIDAAGNGADDRIEDVPNKRVHDRSEGCANDHADCEIDRISTQRKFLEFLEHDCLPGVCACSRALGGRARRRPPRSLFRPETAPGAARMDHAAGTRAALLLPPRSAVS